jgi:hypothetical protein
MSLSDNDGEMKRHNYALWAKHCQLSPGLKPQLGRVFIVAHIVSREICSLLQGHIWPNVVQLGKIQVNVLK